MKNKLTDNTFNDRFQINLILDRASSLCLLIP